MLNCCFYTYSWFSKGSVLSVVVFVSFFTPPTRRPNANAFCVRRMRTRECPLATGTWCRGNMKKQCELFWFVKIACFTRIFGEISKRANFFWWCWRGGEDVSLIIWRINLPLYQTLTSTVTNHNRLIIYSKPESVFMQPHRTEQHSSTESTGEYLKLFQTVLCKLKNTSKV